MPTTKKLTALIICGIFAGMLNGLIGCGGGIVIVFVLSRLGGKNDDPRDVFARAVASILPMSVVSAVIYCRGGDVGEVISSMPIYIVPAVCGGIAGAYLLDVISVPWLKRIFSLLVIWAGVSLVLRGTGVL